MMDDIVLIIVGFDWFSVVEKKMIFEDNVCCVFKFDV